MAPLRRMKVVTPVGSEECEPEILRQYPQGDGRMRELTPELQRQEPAGGGGSAPAQRDLLGLATALNDLRAQFQRLEEMQVRTLAATYANLMTRQAYPVTTPARTYPGSDWATSGEYRSIYKNETRRPINVQVQVNFGSIAGGGLQLSFGVDNAQAFEVLSTNGLVSSEWILLTPDQQLFASSTNTAIDLTGAIVRVLEFDPVKIFGRGIMP